MASTDDIVARIDREALIRFALEICNIDSAVPHEAAVAEHIYQWMLREGFTARRIGLLPDRFNVMGVLPGTGGGHSLMFNGHLDTYAARERDLVHLDPAAAVYHSAWREDDLLIGEGIANDKGPIAAFLMAAKAIKDSGQRLKGDLVLTCVIAGRVGSQLDASRAYRARARILARGSWSRMAALPITLWSPKARASALRGSRPASSGTRSPFAPRSRRSTPPICQRARRSREART